jgi:RNA-dependent RNA polymerase
VAVRRELRRKQYDDAQGDDDEGDEGDDDENDYEMSTQAEEILSRSWAAWIVAGEVLEQSPDEFGPQSFGLIALGSMLKVVQEASTEEERLG